MFFLYFVLPFVPVISSVIVIWYFWKSSKLLASKNKFAKRLIQMGVFLLLMGGFSFILLVILSPFSYLSYLTFIYVILVGEGLVLLLGGCVSLVIGINNKLKKK